MAEAVDTDSFKHPESSSPEFSVTLLQESLDAISQAAEAGDLDKSNEPIISFLRLVTTLANSAVFEAADDDTYMKTVVVLSQIQSYICNPSLDMGIINALSFGLPKVLARFAGLSNQCLELIQSVFDLFAEKCISRDIIKIFCEALACYGATEEAFGYVPPLLHGLSKAFISIARPDFQMVKEAIPAVLNAIKVACYDYETRDTFVKAISLTTSIEALCEKCGESRDKEQLRALLGLFVLQIMALVTINMWNEADCIDMVVEVLRFFRYCGFSYSGLVTGRQVERISALVFEGDPNDCIDLFSYVKHGAVLSVRLVRMFLIHFLLPLSLVHTTIFCVIAVLWGHTSDEAAQAAGKDMVMLKYKLRGRQIEKWEALGMLKYILFDGQLPWELKRHALDFLVAITSMVDKPQIDDQQRCGVQIPSLSSSLEGLMMVMKFAPSAALKKIASLALKFVLADIPGPFRFDLMQVLVRNSSSSHTTSFILNCAKDFLGSAYHKHDGGVKEEETLTFLWSANVLQLVEVVLCPPGGQPSLLAQCSAIRSALSLYRLVLMTESEGKTNYTKVLSKSNLEKAYNGWLLPLQNLLSSIPAKSGIHSRKVEVAHTTDLNNVKHILDANMELVKSKLEDLAVSL